MIDKADLHQVLNRLMEHYRVYAPVTQNGVTRFEELADGDQADFSPANTTLSPKSLMLPQSECMFEFTTGEAGDRGGILQEIEQDYSPRLIFGIRPCDAKAFELLDLNFDTPAHRDPWWVRRRESTTLVGIGCNRPCSTCFCTSVGSGPFSPDGLDVLLTDLDEHLVAEVLTEKGRVLLERADITAEVPAEALETALQYRQTAQQSVTSVVPSENLKRQSGLALFDAAFWDEVQFACIGCVVCTFVCPTCWCFDIQDEVHRDKGVRLRNWDACMFPLFTLHGSGHNPRSQKVRRVRQRFMHKLKYFLDRYDSGVACVGCGRCVQHCPVNIDIREIFRLMNDYEC
jgi:formate hydrogenlyase subunit 6/NADH:ubiquinone oxidoreductase subunit I